MVATAQIPEALVLALADEPAADIVAVYAEDGGITVLFTVATGKRKRRAKTARVVADTVVIRDGFLT